MSFSEEWKQLPGQTKMFIIGGGGLALFFLFSSIKNRNSGQSQQDTTGPQQLAVDPTSWIDTQNQQMQSMQQLIGGMTDSLTQYEQSNQQANQQNMQAMQQLITQNQQATQQELQTLISNMSKAPSYPAATPPAPSPTSAPSASSSNSYTVQNGDNLWNIAKYHVLGKGASNAAIQSEVNVLASKNHISNPNLIYAGQKISW